MLDVFLDSLLDSLKIAAIALAFHLVLSFFEDKISKKLEKSKKYGPLIGSSVGLIPQCGISVISADLYVKEHITIGTIIAVFIACSDEALPILFSEPSKIGYAFLLLAFKFVIALMVGYSVDLIFKKRKDAVKEHFHQCHHKEEIHVGCCGHEIDNEKENKWHKHLLHPLIHTLKLFVYVFVITFGFGILIYYIGEDNVYNFIESNKYLSPLFSSIIGLIPNCASSVIITKLYIANGIGIGALLAGLIVNAGLGLFYLLRKDKNKKKVLLLILFLFLISLIFGYVVSLIFGFK